MQLPLKQGGEDWLVGCPVGHPTRNKKDIYFAANADDALRFPDCSSDFIDALNEVWQQCPNTKGIRVITPFINYSKVEVISQAQRLGVNLTQTISCYDPRGKIECGKCLSCVLKNKALVEFGAGG